METTAKETLEITREGSYAPDSGGPRVEIAALAAAAISGTKLYRPTELEELVAGLNPINGAHAAVSVANETSQTAARRMAAESAIRSGIVVLNFASAMNPGGGFLIGAEAQEEDLCRSSALYSCLVGQAEYYETNRANRSEIYTDHLIYSPAVPFFREARDELLAAPYLASVITSPAPNAGAFGNPSADVARAIEAALSRRIAHILAVAADNGHRDLILGAWGCGAFRNQPEVVARLFRRWLNDQRFAARFDRVHFPVLDRTREGENITTFTAELAGESSR